MVARAACANRNSSRASFAPSSVRRTCRSPSRPGAAGARTRATRSGIALRMQDAGARAFTLHARTRTQMFSGHANWDEIARVVEALDIPVIGNGDIAAGGGRREDEGAHRLRRRDDRPRRLRQPLDLPRRAGRCSTGARSRRRPTPAERFRVALEHARLAHPAAGRHAQDRHGVPEAPRLVHARGCMVRATCASGSFRWKVIAEAESSSWTYLCR